MARKYSRDNRGRFASVGATARGGRLRTASGKKRETVKGKIEGAVPSGTIRPGRRSAKPASAAPASAARRQRVRGNFRPQNLLTRTDAKTSKGYGTDAKANVAEARRRIEAKGATSALKSNKRSSSVASVSERSPNTVNVNASHTAWRNPRQDMIKSRRKNEFSTSSANHYVAHELGHIKNPSNRMAASWNAQLRKKGEMLADADRVVGAQRTARRVSQYAMRSPAEFAAEVSAGRSLGKKYDHKVMRQYRQVNGRRARPVRSQLKSGTIDKPKGLKPGAIKAKPAAKPAARRADRAEANIPMRGARGRRLDADISRAVRQVNAAETARLMKPKAQVRAERAARAEARQAAAAAKPKRTRSAESLRVSRAKQVEKRRGMNINNPAAWRQESAGRMAANAKRTQERALAFYNAAKKRRRSG